MMKIWYILVQWILVLITPFFLLSTAIRITITPLYPELDYRTPNFPDDPYGFTLEDRLHWSKYAINYLLNNADISYLGNLSFPDGTSLYNERELSHMADVKKLVQSMVIAWCILLALILAAAIWFWRSRYFTAYLQAFVRGSWLAICLIVAGLLGVLLSFNTLFTDFHKIFFEGSSWVFYYSDTLIRLFPIRFWQDAFITVGILTVVFSILIIIFGTKLIKKG